MPNLRNITEVQEISSLTGEEKVLLNVNGEAMQARADLIKPDVKTFPVVDVINEGDKVLLNVNGEQKQADASLVKPNVANLPVVNVINEGDKVLLNVNGEQKQADASLVKPKNLVGKMTEGGGEIFNNYSENIASGANSHAEGIRTLAYGAQSHAEGFGPPNKHSGTLNVISSKIAGENYRRNCHITVIVDYSTSQDSFYVNDIKFNKHTIFMYDNKICNVFDVIKTEDSPDSDSTSFLIKIIDPIEIPTGIINITFVEQGAIGTSSHAEGGKTIAAGQSSHAEGFGCKVLYKTANGDPIGAHAEGSNTVAMGKGSHAEGGDTHAEGKNSHAEGEETIATALCSHAEGFRSTASGESSHAEGRWVDASGDYSHAEGYYTTASGDYSHAEGRETTASGDYSHVEGHYTTASGSSSHAEGDGTTASGESSHAEGIWTDASGDYSHAEGSGTTASGESSHAEGKGTTASGAGSHAEGRETTASGEASHVEGRYNIDDPASKYAHIVGNGTDYEERSNAHTLDWDGNVWYAGALLLGQTTTTEEIEQLDKTGVVIMPGQGITFKTAPGMFGIRENAVVLKSSTPGSSKYFEISVDDTGIVKATDVTSAVNPPVPAEVSNPSA